jgi:hypothetical protein
MKNIEIQQEVLSRKNHHNLIKNLSFYLEAFTIDIKEYTIKAGGYDVNGRRRIIVLLLNADGSIRKKKIVHESAKDDELVMKGLKGVIQEFKKIIDEL